jgi:uncharacterized repeat protein (TIGR01451 family)
VTVDPGALPGTLTNTANATSATADPAPGNNTGTATTTVAEPPPPAADLSVTKTDSPDPVMPGSDLTYTIAVTNNGPADTDAATVADTVPSGTTLVSVTPSQGSCDGTTDVLCALGPLANGATAVVTLIVHVDPAVSPGTIISNTASVNPRIVRPPGPEPVPPGPLPPRGAAEPSPLPGARQRTTDPEPGNDNATATTTVADPGRPSEPGIPTAPGAAGSSRSPSAPARTARSTVASPVVARPTFTG